jgi:hypothetical protein
MTPDTPARSGTIPDEVDVIVLTRDGAPPPEPVRQAIRRQASPLLTVDLHVVTGSNRPDEPIRWATIARKRNAGRRLGKAPFVMFVDDDVILGPGCIARLVEGLKRRPGHAALAADYMGESRPGDTGPLPSPHVGMGATMFRREVLAFLPFRWEEDRCECRCCVDDLRRAGFAIDYLPEARAHHLPSLTTPRAGAEERPAGASPPTRPPVADHPRILAAFSRAHARKFRRVFLPTLRAAGNPELVVAVGYGLMPSEQRRLAHTPGLELINQPDDGICPAIARLNDFAAAVARWPEGTPVAYWDAGDVAFQARLGPLWDLVRAHPDRLLAARESFGILDNTMALKWVLSISDPHYRRLAFDRFTTSPYLNSGFGAGTAGTMRRYFQEADRLLRSPSLTGSTDWGDQTAFNLYCHTDPSRWHEVPRGWNFATCRLNSGEVRLSHDGRFVARDGTPIYVAHGNARTLPHLELSHLHDGDG